jgi:hypothetical protein
MAIAASVMMSSNCNYSQVCAEVSDRVCQSVSRQLDIERRFAAGTLAG